MYKQIRLSLIGLFAIAITAMPVVAQTRTPLGTNTLVVDKKGKAGVENAAGKKVIPVKYDKIEEFKPGFLQVWDKDAVGLFDTDGKELIKPKAFHKLEALDDSLVLATTTTQQGIYNLKQRKFIVSPTMSEIKPPIEVAGETYWVSQQSSNNKWGVTNSKGDVVAPYEAVNMIAFPEEDIIYLSGATWDSYAGKSFDFRVLWFMKDNVFIDVSRVGINNKGAFKEFSALVFKDLGQSSWPSLRNSNRKAYAKLQESMDRKWFYAMLDKNGNFLSLGRDVEQVGENYLVNGKMFDKDGNPLGGEGFTEDGYTYSQQNGKWGVSSSGGKVVVDYKYDESPKMDFHHNFFIVKNGDKIGILSRQDGKEILPCVYDSIEPLVNAHQRDYWYEYYRLEKDGKKGIMHRDGIITIPVQYDDIITDGHLCVATAPSGKTYYERDGSRIEDTTPRIVVEEESVKHNTKFLGQLAMDVQFDFKTYFLQGKKITVEVTVYTKSGVPVKDPKDGQIIRRTWETECNELTESFHGFIGILYSEFPVGSYERKNYDMKFVFKDENGKVLPAIGNKTIAFYVTGSKYKN